MPLTFPSCTMKGRIPTMLILRLSKVGKAIRTSVYKLEIYPNWEPTLALRYYLQAISYKPDYGMPHNQMGTLAMNQNHFLDAVYHYMRCMACKNVTGHIHESVLNYPLAERVEATKANGILKDLMNGGKKSKTKLRRRKALKVESDEESDASGNEDDNYSSSDDSFIWTPKIFWPNLLMRMWIF
ncbi:hypothetical protein NQ318_005088 [Aromia moschata]|uniref:DNA/RNA-binding domain-containing protein n=1 Tax=Aromia moschata TaxID=1265417 RepID=A0AAV8XB98_9CUCU|nr:hypothetical protein NQ318_005088 [Aromia moschata]